MLTPKEATEKAVKFYREATGIMFREYLRRNNKKKTETGYYLGLTKVFSTTKISKVFLINGTSGEVESMTLRQ
jgi:hypothetical protein